ncbi:MAG: EAL domain-containing protein [Sphaerochaetaceae bacterium]
MKHSVKSVFCLYISIRALDEYHFPQKSAASEAVYEGCALKLTDYFGQRALMRMASDEFALLLYFPAEVGQSEEKRQTHQQHICQKLVGELEAVIDSYTHSLILPFSLSIGCGASGIRYHAQTIEQLIDLAYYAEQEARASHKAYLVADVAIQARKLDMDECRKGFRVKGWEKEFTPFYQPIVDLQSFAILGAEALARWQLGGFRIIAAHVFKDIAQQMHLIQTIDTLIIGKTCTAVERMSANNLLKDPFKVVFNVSDESLQQGFADWLYQLVSKRNLVPADVELDINESALYSPLCLAVITQLKQFGFRISLDAFTEKAFDLRLLMRTEFDVIKLDFSIYSAGLAPIYASLVQTAKQRGIEVLAKGIEDGTTLQAAKRFGCTYAQGNYFTPPIPESAYSLFMQKYRDGVCVGLF